MAPDYSGVEKYIKNGLPEDSFIRDACFDGYEGKLYHDSVENADGGLS